MAMQVYTKNQVEISDASDSSSSSDTESNAGHEVTGQTETVQAAPVPVYKCVMCGAMSDEADWFALIRVFDHATLRHIEVPTGDLCAADGMAMEMFPKFRCNSDAILSAIKSEPEFAALYGNIKSPIADRTELSKRIDTLHTRLGDFEDRLDEAGATGKASYEMHIGNLSQRAERNAMQCSSAILGPSDHRESSAETGGPVVQVLVRRDYLPQ